MALPAGFETASDLLERMGAHRTVPVPAALAPMLPQRGLERGCIYGIAGDAAVSLVYALVADATAAGAWCAFVDMPHAGLRSAHEHGVALQRVVCVDTVSLPDRTGSSSVSSPDRTGSSSVSSPDRTGSSSLSVPDRSGRSSALRSRVIGALVEGIDIVVVHDPVFAPADARRIAARAKAQGAVIIVHGRTEGFPVDAHLVARTESWRFDACAVERRVRVDAGGRRLPGTRSVTVLLPSAQGRAAVP